MTTWDEKFAGAMQSARAALAQAKGEIWKTGGEGHYALSQSLTEIAVLRVSVEGMLAEFTVATAPRERHAADALVMMQECEGGPGFSDAVGAFCSIALREGWTANAVNEALAPYNLEVLPK